MDLVTYQREALRTAQAKEPNLRLAIAALGLACEAGETLEVTLGDLDEARLIKEIGDTMWYIAEVASTVGISLGDLGVHGIDVPPAGSATIIDVNAKILAVRACAVSDYLKKVVGHGHDLDLARLSGSLASVVAAAGKLSANVGVSLGEVCEQNIAKLRARYPEGFSSTRSINRPSGE